MQKADFDNTTAPLPTAWKFHATLAHKIILSIGGLFLVLAIGVTALTFVQVRQATFAQLETKGVMLADTLNYTFEVLLGQEAFSSLQRVAENSALTPDVREVVIAERDGTVRVSNDRRAIGAPTSSPFLRTFLAQADWQHQAYVTENNQLVLLQPLRGGRSVAGSDGDVVGAVQITIDRQDAETTARRAALQLLGISLGSFLLLSAILVIVSRVLVVRPLQQLVTVANHFSAGDRSLRSRISRRDEIGLLASAFDGMANHVETLLESLEARIVEAQEARTAAEQANQLKSQFLASMSHELRTPLNSIINFTRILSSGMRGPVNEGQLDYLGRVCHSGEHLLGLINDILDLSKIEAGRMELVKEPLQIGEVVQSVMATAVGLTKDKPIELRQEIEADLPVIEADRTRVRQILLNLLSNAAKFTEQGSITVRAMRMDDYLVVHVVDTGIGIAREHLSAIFEEFRQVDGGSNRRYEGTGLGLPICRHLVELHGGRLWVESSPSIGSTFGFSLPIVESPAHVDMVRSQMVTPTRPDGIPVIVIDDDLAAIEIVTTYLSRDGYSVYGVRDSRHALDEVRRLKPAAIILDILMPHEDGWEVLAALKADPELQAVPVVLYTIVEEQQLGFYLGASAYLVKPINEAQLRATVGQLVTHSSTVLVIDDDPNAREIISNELTHIGLYRVTTAGGGQEGLDRIAELRPDLIILDLMMPEVDGFAVLDQMQQQRETHDIPVIVMTSKDLTSRERKLLNQRVREVMAKGQTSPERLLEKVSELVHTTTEQATISR